MRIDLHTHSTESDGTETPAELVTAAAAAGLDVVAITDHDTTAGWAAAAEALPAGLRLIRGAEFSAVAPDGEGGQLSVHLLGYLFDPASAAVFAAEAVVELPVAGGATEPAEDLPRAGAAAFPAGPPPRGFEPCPEPPGGPAAPLGALNAWVPGGWGFGPGGDGAHPRGDAAGQGAGLRFEGAVEGLRSMGLPDARAGYGASSADLVPREVSGDDVAIELHADVIVYGRARPGAAVWVSGLRVQVRPDGTFEARFALPAASPAGGGTRDGSKAPQ